jgi:hypothetical protein
MSIFQHCLSANQLVVWLRPQDAVQLQLDTRNNRKVVDFHYGLCYCLSHDEAHHNDKHSKDLGALSEWPGLLGHTLLENLIVKARHWHSLARAGLGIFSNVKQLVAVCRRH